MNHSKILNDFSTSTWPQSSIKTVPGASFLNPEQTCQSGRKIWERNLICHPYVVNSHSNFHLQCKGWNVERSQLFSTIFHTVVALCFLRAVATLEKHSLVRFGPEIILGNWKCYAWRQTCRDHNQFFTWTVNMAGGVATEVPNSRGKATWRRSWPKTNFLRLQTDE